MVFKIMPEGTKFGMLTFIRLTRIRTLPKGQKRPVGLFMCDCGHEHETDIGTVKSGRTASCGCSRRGEPKTLDDLFDKAIPEPMSGCWLWTMSATDEGYGRLSNDGRLVFAHRLSYSLHTGDGLSPKDDICHKCDVPSCINPLHLFKGTRADNMRDASRKGRLRGPGLSGEECGSSKLTVEQVKAIRADTRTNAAISRDYPVSNVMIANIKKGRSWKSVQ